ncbi:heavy-metal-associated domain-containing protein [Pontibacter actiniarum]|uniref:heavy-metal-associated domain-containing protein n=1 Tax=Pontibacter actiniarum TaxID=323450 RepID=UPI000E6A8BC8|nr:heavy metal-associated domain-containing protein [Pontibacter actiniarum]
MENEKQNYNRSQSGNVVEETFPVQGMTCGGCANGVQRSLTKLEGVKSVEVSLADASARVAYDPGAVSPEQMQQAVENAGFRFGKSEGEESDKSERSGGCC